MVGNEKNVPFTARGPDRPAPVRHRHSYRRRVLPKQASTLVADPNVTASERTTTLTATIVYNDTYGATIDWADEDYVEIRWYDATSKLTSDEFNRWLEAFASSVESAKRSGILVDAVQFKMDMAKMDAAWRDANIIPRYNAAGVARFAFLMPPGMPAIGASPAPEGPADFPTGYFGTRADALAWLKS